MKPGLRCTRMRMSSPEAPMTIGKSSADEPRDRVPDSRKNALVRVPMSTMTCVPYGSVDVKFQFARRTALVAAADLRFRRVSPWDWAEPWVLLSTW